MEVIKFGADWCSACKAMDLMFTDESKNWKIVDVDENPELVLEHGVSKLPTLLFIGQNGEVVRHVGAMTKDQYNSYINQTPTV